LYLFIYFYFLFFILPSCSLLNVRDWPLDNVDDATVIHTRLLLHNIIQVQYAFWHRLVAALYFSWPLRLNIISIRAIIHHSNKIFFVTTWTFKKLLLLLFILFLVTQCDSKTVVVLSYFIFRILVIFFRAHYWNCFNLVTVRLTTCRHGQMCKHNIVVRSFLVDKVLCYIILCSFCLKDHHFPRTTIAIGKYCLHFSTRPDIITLRTYFITLALVIFYDVITAPPWRLFFEEFPFVGIT